MATINQNAIYLLLHLFVATGTGTRLQPLLFGNAGTENSTGVLPNPPRSKPPPNQAQRCKAKAQPYLGIQLLFHVGTVCSC